MEKTDHRKALIQEIVTLSQSQGLNNVFTTFLEFVAISIGAQQNTQERTDRESRYNEIVKNMEPKVLSSYTRMFELLWLTVIEHMEDPCDILGGVFHELCLSNEWNGQFFIPNNTCRLMAQLTIRFDSFNGAKNPMIIREPSCGSGAMVIGTIWAMKQQKIDYASTTFFIAYDIDIRCVWMAYIQLSLYGIPAIVIHGNTLTQEEWSRWFTPCACLPFIGHSSDSIPSEECSAEV